MVSYFLNSCMNLSVNLFCMLDETASTLQEVKEVTKKLPGLDDPAYLPIKQGD